MPDYLGQSSAVTYDAAGRVTSTTNGAGEKVERSYDALGRILSVAASGSTTTHTYDAAGNRVAMADSLGQTTYSYDAGDRLISIGSGPQGSVSYGYDLAGNRTALRQPAAEVTYTYDALNRLASVGMGSAKVVTYTYDSVGRIVGQTFGNGIATAFSYDKDGRLTGLATSGPNGELQRLGYTLDVLGNRTAESSTGFNANYRYDALSRLKEATVEVLTKDAPLTQSIYLPFLEVRSRTSQSANTDFALSTTAGPGQVTTTAVPQRHTYAYSYDAVGNRVSASQNAITTTYTYDGANRMTSAGATVVTYDAAGRLTNDGINRYAYDALDRLTAISGQVGATFQYDGDGNRVVETVNGVTSEYLLDLAAPLPARIAVRAAGKLGGYVYGVQRVMEYTPNGDSRYEHGDGLGSVRLRTDKAGAMIDISAYSPTGERLSGAGPFGFTGEPYVAGGGLVHLRARDYSPTLARFLTMDPREPDVMNPQTLNEYTYALNNPVNLVDHTGASPSFGFGSGGYSASGGSSLFSLDFLKDYGLNVGSPFLSFGELTSALNQPPSFNTDSLFSSSYWIGAKSPLGPLPGFNYGSLPGRGSSFDDTALVSAIFPALSKKGNDLGYGRLSSKQVAAIQKQFSSYSKFGEGFNYVESVSNSVSNWYQRRNNINYASQQQQGASLTNMLAESMLSYIARYLP